MKKLLSAIIIFFALGITESKSQILITPGGGAASVISAIGGAGLTLSNVTINCANTAFGTYNNAAAGGFGASMSNGLLLTTGSAAGVAGTGNVNDDYSTCVGTSSTDPQLTAVIGASVNDACIIEFDVTPQCNNLQIRFVFGSDEYTNWVSAGFNDGFGFFVSGPNPAGGNYTNYNLAQLPSGTLVSIDNVNTTTNSAFFINNNAGGSANHFDGFTTVLNPTMNVTPCATYHFKLAIGDASDCAMDSGVLIDLIQCTAPWTVAMSSTPTGCGAPSGTATATVSGGIGPFTYSWAPGGQTTSSISGLAAGTYTLTSNDGMACTPAQTYTVTVGTTGTPNTVAVPASNSYCNGATVPASTYTSTPAGGTFTWTNSNTAIGLAASGVGNQPSFTGTNAGTTAISGTITVTPTVAGCPGTPSTYTITIKPIPNVTPPANITVCAGATVAASAFVSNVAGATFAWTNSNAAIGLAASGAGNTPSFTATNATTSNITSTITVTPTATGCPGTPVTYTITVKPTPNVTVPANISVCAGAPIAASAYTSNVAGATFAWTNSNPAIGLAASGVGNTPAFTATNAGATAITGTITVTPTATACPGTPVTYTITVNPIPTVTVPANISVCAGTTIAASAFTSNVAGATFAWTNSNPAIGLAASGAGNTPSFTATNAGGAPITATISVTPTAGACPGTPVTYTITINPMPVVTVNSPSICPGGTATLTAAGGTTYSWSSGPVTNPITVSPGATTSYTVTGTSAGCSNTAVATVTVGATMSITVNSPTICAGQTANLVATGATSYTWSAGPTPTGAGTADVTPAATTSYTVTGTTGGCTGTAVSTVTLTTVPTVTVTSPTICNGATATMTAGGATTYTWSAGATTATATTATAAPTTTTTYTVTGANGTCTNTAVSTVTVNAIPTVTVNSPTICLGTTANLTANGATSYTWSAGATSTGVNTADASPASTTSYTVTGTTSGCTNTAVSTVTVAAALAVTVNSPTICAGATANLVGGGATTYAWSAGATSTGANTADATPAATTTYTVTGTTGACTGTAVSTVTVTPLPAVTATNATVCNGTTANISAGGATSYVWSAGATSTGVSTADASPASTTSYTVTGTTSGCSNTAVSTVTVNPIPTVTVNSPSVCPGITANLTAGGAATYTWSAGATSTGVNTVDASPASTTSYTVTGTALGCVNTAVSTVTVAASMTITVNSPTICAGTTANLVAGGATSYSWTAGAISSGVNTANATPAATTTYTVTGTTGACTGTVVSTVTVTPLPVVTVNSPTVCNGVTANLAAGGATTYVWSAGATSTGANTATASPAATTTYTVTGTTSGCSGTAVSTVTVNPIPTVTVNSPSICPGSTAQLTAGGATSYAWSAGATSSGVNTANATPAATTTYTVTGTSLGCSNTAVSTVTVNTVLSVNAGADDSICYGGTANLLVSPNGIGYNYTWTPAATLSNATIYNPSATPVTTTNYSVTVVDPNGCTGSDNVTIFANTQITPNVAGIAATCNGGTDGQIIVIPAGGLGGYTYSWTGGCTAAACNVIAGTYTVTVTDSWNGGCTATGTATVTQPTAVTATTTQINTTCNGTCNGTATVNAVGGTPLAGGAYNYSWNTVPVQTTQTATGLCAGSYTCVVKDANGCSPVAVVNVTITEPSAIVITPIADVTICNSGSTVLNTVAVGGTGAYGYLWNPSTGLSSATVANPTAAPASTTPYIVTVTDANGCTATEPVTVTVNPPLAVVTAGTASVCPGSSAVITATASQGQGGSYNYSWSPSTGLNNSTLAAPTASPAATTTYTVTVTDGCSPSVTATVTVTVMPVPVPVITSDLKFGCNPVCVKFTDASTISSGTITAWDWSFGDSAPDSVTQNPSHCFIADGTDTVHLTVTSAAGCSATTIVPYVITVNPIPHADFIAPASTSIFTPTVQYNDQSTVAIGSITNWDWNFGDGLSTIPNDSSNQQNPSHLFTEAGTYCAELIVTSNKGCKDTTTLCIIIDPEFTFFIPNAFSPNDDGINDEFYGKGEYINKYEMYIYDRWGNMIFSADDINKHWDGKANHGSEIAQEDVYVYVVKLSDNHDKIHKYIGTVTIVK